LVFVLTEKRLTILSDMTYLEVGDGVDCLPSIGQALAHAGKEIDEVRIHPGVYVEHLVVPPRTNPLTIRSTTGRAEDVVITFTLCQGDRNGTGMEFVQDCATLTIDADDVVLADLTIENGFDKRLWPGRPNSQAIALRTRGDRIRVERCRMLGQQDTVLLDAPGYASVRRVHLVDCYIQGDVDFLYGRATALIEGGEIHSVAPGYIAAPSTAKENPRGYLFHGVRLTAAEEVAAGSVKLGRPWHPGGKPDAIGQALFVNCELGAHIAEAAWDEMGGFAWQDARFGEFGNSGPGATLGTDRPQLHSAPDPKTWLVEPSPTGTPRIIVIGDSTASWYGPERAPRWGWAQALPSLVCTPVLNHAVSGASTRSFIDSGALDEVLFELRPADHVLVGFGHNEYKPDERFSDVFTQLESNLRRFIVGIRARGAHPVLLTPIERRSFDDRGKALSTHGGYPERIRVLAAAENLPLVDLTTLTRRVWQKQGIEGSKSSFLHLKAGEWPGYPEGEMDDTHLSRAGADAVARIVVDSLGLQ
jgi:lysophospholipase L1-like esterase